MSGAPRRMANGERPQFLKPPSTQSAVLSELRFWLMEGDLEPGSRLVVDQISAKLNVSPVPVREALRILEGEGQVTYAPHRGYRVAEFSLDDLREIYRICDILEADAIRIAVPLLDEEHIARLGTHLAETETAEREGDLLAWTMANWAFHFELFAAANRPILLKTLDHLWSTAQVYQGMLNADDLHRELSGGEHRAILEAAASGDAEATVAAHSAHRHSTLKSLERLLSSD